MSHHHGDEHEKQARVREATKAGESPSAAGATTGADHQKGSSANPKADGDAFHAEHGNPKH